MYPLNEHILQRLQSSFKNRMPAMLSLLKAMIKFLLVFALIGILMQPLRAGANAQTPDDAALSAFVAILTAPGIAIEWQANGDGIDWGFTLYRSQNCQFDGAVEVVAPIFSSINDETQIARYTLIDTQESVAATCAYWLVATEGNGNTQQFGPYQVQGRSTVYLPLALR